MGGVLCYMGEWVATKSLSKKKYFKSTPKYCPNHKGEHCMCEIGTHRYWMSKKYYGDYRERKAMESDALLLT